MGREARRVPPTWTHPKNEDGHKRPLYCAEWFDGDVQDWIENPDDWPKKPVPEDYMPKWPEGEATHWQMYETCTEGTPISPVCQTPELLAKWLVENKASTFANFTADYETWMRIIRGSDAYLIVTPGVGLHVEVS